MPTSYIPSKDADLKAFAINFAAIIAASFAMYGLTAPDSTLINTVTTDFTDALALVTSPDTRTKPNVASKDAVKHVLISTLRTYSQQIKANKAITNDQKESLGIHVNDGSSTPVPAPTTQPLLAIIGATPLQHTIRFADASTPASRAKPSGAIGLLLFCKIAATASTSPDGSQFVQMYGKQPATVNFNSEDVGKMATYFGKWVTRRGLEGPWSSPVSMTIAG